MITRISIGVALVALLAVGGARIAQPSTVTAASDELYGLTTANELVVFTKAAPGATSAPIAITGLQPGEVLLGIDTRPATNELYALGHSSRLYRINPESGMATAVGPVLDPMLDGDIFGFDFNNAVDRIRIVSDTGQNLRAHPDTGVVVAVDGDLAFVAEDENAGAMPMVVAAAYTNPDNDPGTGTALFNVDAAANRLLLQDPPNDGGLQTIGSLGLPEGSTVHSLDIGSEPPDALLLATPGMDGAPTLYRVNLETGETTFIGEVGESSVVSIAILVEAAPAPPTPTPTPMEPTATPTMVPPMATPTDVPPAATPTMPAPMPPNTGTGEGQPGSMSTAWLVVLLAAGSAVAFGFAVRKRAN